MDSSEVSIVIPTFNRASLVSHAIESALSQTVRCEVIVCDHGSTDGTPDVMRGYGNAIKYIRRTDDRGPIFCWLDGVLSASNEYVHLNYDDDWIDARFIESTLELMDSDIAFVFSDACVHLESGTTESLWKDLFPTGIHDGRLIEDYLLAGPLTISPGCALFRKKDAINALFVGETPFASSGYRGAGPDLLMFLTPLLRCHKFGFVNEGLAHFRAHSGSITTAALRDESNTQQLIDAYTDAKRFYLLSKKALKTNLPGRLLESWRRRKAVRRRLGKIFAIVRRAVRRNG